MTYAGFLLQLPTQKTHFNSYQYPSIIVPSKH